ncbi:hypothetical protein M405DRAFT_887586 [Rhizopogon salebrosus TDB-379]|nr:hypothetical protein M405DRAFT_887586 [Rhizopogon salebrosus TDB-379]
MKCDATDNKDLWDWAVFRDKGIWVEHGAAVAACAPYLPGSFDRPPRNPAEKINTFYKAWEFILWLWGLGPGLLYSILPDKYWQNFCKFVRGIQEAHDCFCKWENEFEQLYYQRRGDRINFIRPCAHQSNHLAAEGFRSGPSVCYTQWTMERVIGMLGMEICQPSNPFSNLTFLAICCCQINALKVMIPDLEPPDGLPPKNSVNIGDGYVLLRACDRYTYNPSEAESHLIHEFLNAPVPKFKWCARLWLPNGQIARCTWKETLRSADKVRMAQNVKVSINNRHEIAEVLYYARLAVKVQADDINNENDEELEYNDDGIYHFVMVAMVSVYSHPDPELLQRSTQTVWSCKHEGDQALQLVGVKSIQSVVAMIPHRHKLPSGVVED